MTRAPGKSAEQSRGPKRRTVLAAGPARSSLSRGSGSYMKAQRNAVGGQEPVGIIISPGAPQESAPARFAYVWAPPPQEVDEEKQTD